MQCVAVECRVWQVGGRAAHDGGLVGAGEWNEIVLLGDSDDAESNRELCPVTARILESHKQVPEAVCVTAHACSLPCGRAHCPCMHTARACVCEHCTAMCVCEHCMCVSTVCVSAAYRSVNFRGSALVRACSRASLRALG